MSLTLASLASDRENSPIEIIAFVNNEMFPRKSSGFFQFHLIVWSIYHIFGFIIHSTVHMSSVKTRDAFTFSNRYLLVWSGIGSFRISLDWTYANNVTKTFSRSPGNLEHFISCRLRCIIFFFKKQKLQRNNVNKRMNPSEM